MPKYTDQQRKAAVKSRLANIMAMPAPEYPCARKNGRIVVELNGKETVVDLEPYPRHVAQWRVTINGKLFNEHCGMSKVYDEIARLNKPARNFY